MWPYIYRCFLIYIYIYISNIYIFLISSVLTANFSSLYIFCYHLFFFPLNQVYFHFFFYQISVFGGFLISSSNFTIFLHVTSSLLSTLAHQFHQKLSQIFHLYFSFYLVISVSTFYSFVCLVDNRSNSYSSLFCEFSMYLNERSLLPIGALGGSNVKDREN